MIVPRKGRASTLKSGRMRAEMEEALLRDSEAVPEAGDNIAASLVLLRSWTSAYYGRFRVQPGMGEKSLEGDDYRPIERIWVAVVMR